MKNIIKKGISELGNEIINCRHHLHQNPELSFKEFKTSEYIKSKLRENNIEYDESLSETSVIAKIQVRNNNEWIAVRADIDALSIVEEFESDFKSQNEGVMHACGHDAHTAILLGLAFFLKKNIHLLKENILLIFQAGEEKNPGGAKILIDNGLLSKYKINKIIAQHVDPDIESGAFSFGEGNLMASCDELYIDFSGIGGHAAIPEKHSETVLAASKFICEAKLLEKHLNEKDPIIIAFGKIIANGAVNIIPSNVRIEGTIRTYDSSIRTLLKNTLKENARIIAEENKCKCDFVISEGYPNLHNDSKLYKEIMEFVKYFLPEEKILESKKRMSSEDFAWYSQEIPAALYRFGIKGNGYGNYPLHNSKFNIDEKALLYACELMAFLTVSLAGGKN